MLQAYPVWLDLGLNKTSVISWLGFRSLFNFFVCYNKNLQIHWNVFRLTLKHNPFFVNVLHMLEKTVFTAEWKFFPYVFIPLSLLCFYFSYLCSATSIWKRCVICWFICLYFKPWTRVCVHVIIMSCWSITPSIRMFPFFLCQGYIKSQEPFSFLHLLLMFFILFSPYSFCVLF